MSASGFIGWLAQTDARIWQAVIAGAFVASGWVYNGWQNRREAARLRAERLRDVHRALYAEIGTTLANLWGDDNLRDQADRMIRKMREDPDFVPFIPREHGDFVYDAIVAEIHILPRRTIDPIVAYYSQIKAIAAHAEDMRGDGFRALVQDRRIEMYSDYVAMKDQLLQFGIYATKMIAAFSEGGNEAADRLAAKINTQVADQSGPSRESV